jgi:hypothetical protein
MTRHSAGVAGRLSGSNLAKTSWVCAILGEGKRRWISPQIPAPQSPNLFLSFLEGLLAFTWLPMSPFR